MEPEKHPQLIRAEIISSDNVLGFAVKIEETIIDDADEIINQFYDLYVYHHKIAQEVDNKKANLSVLAWTTTPWTLPSNMFLAV
jgi:isoleucyl-tRNA synthetase